VKKKGEVWNQDFEEQTVQVKRGAAAKTVQGSEEETRAEGNRWKMNRAHASTGHHKMSGCPPTLQARNNRRRRGVLGRKEKQGGWIDKFICEKKVGGIKQIQGYNAMEPAPRGRMWKVKDFP